MPSDPLVRACVYFASLINYTFLSVLHFATVVMHERPNLSQPATPIDICLDQYLLDNFMLQISNSNTLGFTKSDFDKVNVDRAVFMESDFKVAPSRTVTSDIHYKDR